MVLFSNGEAGLGHSGAIRGRGNTQTDFPSLLEVSGMCICFACVFFVSGGVGMGLGFLRVGWWLVYILYVYILEMVGRSWACHGMGTFPIRVSGLLVIRAEE